MHDLVIRGVRQAGADEVDIGIAAGRIVALARGLPRGGPELDARAAVVAPPFVDAHLHLDKVLHEEAFAQYQPTATLLERVAVARAIQRRSRPMAERAARLLERVAVYGTAAVRTHTDVDLEAGVGGVQQMLELKVRHRERWELQIIAFPQDGLLIRPGVADLLRDALRAGCDGVGGLDPGGVDGDVEGHLAQVLDLAAEFGALVDIHLHDEGSLGMYTLHVLARMTRERGLQGRVAASHCFCLAAADHDAVRRALDALAQAQIGVIVNPRPVPRPMIDPALLSAHGVTAAVASDNVQDAWWPFGDGDLLRTLNHGAQRWRWCTGPELRGAIHYVTEAPRRIMGLPSWRLAVGEPASLLLLHARSLEEALIECCRRTVVWNGVVRTGAAPS
jgi:cytosine deaminase